MSNSKISALTAATTPVAGTEVLPIVQSSATVKLAISDLTPGLATITAAKGGTGQTTYTIGDTLYASSTTALSKLGIGTADYVLTSSGTAPQWSASLKAVAGGTGQTSYAVGDILYASTTTALSKLADVATGNALISGGVSTAPSWGKIDLTTHISGTLAVGNGGTGLTTLTAGYIPFGNGTSAFGSDAGLYWDSTNKRLAVGITTTPLTTIEGYATANSLQIISSVRNNQAGSGVAAIGFNVASSAAADTSACKAGIGLQRGAAQGVGFLAFYNRATTDTASFTTTDEKMRIASDGNVLVTSAAGLGYGTGSGGTATQGTSRTTGVTLSKPTGAITMFSAAGSVVAATFTVTNTLVAATDTIILNQKSGTNLYVLLVTAVAAGSFNITFYTTGGVATDAPVINFSIIKGVTA